MPAAELPEHHRATDTITFADRDAVDPELFIIKSLRALSSDGAERRVLHITFCGTCPKNRSWCPSTVGVHRQGGEPAGVESISENKHVWFQDVYRDQVERRRTGISSLALYPQDHGPGGYKYPADRCVKSFVKRLLIPSS